MVIGEGKYLQEKDEHGLIRAREEVKRDMLKRDRGSSGWEWRAGYGKRVKMEVNNKSGRTTWNMKRKKT